MYLNAYGPDLCSDLVELFKPDRGERPCSSAPGQAPRRAVGRNRKFSSAFACLALLLTGALPPAAAAPAPPLPAGLDVVPRDAALFLSVRVADLWALEDVGGVIRRHAQAKDLESFVREILGVGFADMERVTVIWPDTPEPAHFSVMDVLPEKLSRVFVYTMTGPRPASPRLRSVEAEKQRRRGREFTTDADGWTARVNLDDRTFVIGSRASVEWVIDHLQGAGRAGPLGPALRGIRGQPQIVVGGQPAIIKKWTIKRVPVIDAIVTAFGDADTANLTVTARKGMRLDFAAQFRSTDAAARGQERMKALYAVGARTMQGQLDAVSQRSEGRQGPLEDEQLLQGMLQTMRDVHAGLRKAAISRDATTIRASLESSSSSLLVNLAGALGLILPYWPESIDPERPANNDRAIARAFDAYHAQHGTFPPSAIRGKDGKALLSWRVALLPYLGEEGLYREFHLDESWDSAHNRMLIDRMPGVYAEDRRTPYRPRPRTPYQVFVGKDSVFEGPGGLGREDIRGASGNTLLVVRTQRLVPWTKPEDLPFPAEGAPGGEGLMVHSAIMADGSVLSRAGNGTDGCSFDEKMLRRAIRRNGGGKDRPPSRDLDAPATDKGPGQ